jgi:hypothetical protein
MKKFVLALTFMVVLGNERAFADTTQTFNAYGAAILPMQGAAIIDGTSVAFPGFTLYAAGGSVQLDSPGYFGATNYEMLGDQGDLTIDFTVPQNSFSISLRNFAGFPGGLDMITVFGADDTTVLATYSVWLDASIFTSTDAGESAPIGAVNLAMISDREPWTGILQSVTYSTSASTPEPASLSLLGIGAIGVLGLAGMLRRKPIP